MELVVWGEGVSSSSRLVMVLEEDPGFKACFLTSGLKLTPPPAV